MPEHRKRHLLLLLAGAGGLLVAGAAAGVVVLLSGVMSTSATKQHFLLTHRILDVGLEYSVRRYSERFVAPPLDDPAMAAQGLACYRTHCVSCHGAPGIAPDPAARGMLPIPSNLADVARKQEPEWLYYVTRKGVRMTGMPAWEYRLSEHSLWSTVAFLEELPGLSVADYRARAAASADVQCAPRTDLPAPGEDLSIWERALAAAPGEVLLRQYACHSCHVIEGVVGPRIFTGPPLVDWSRRGYIAGVLPNTPANLAHWIIAPQSVSPGTLMPALDVAPEHARVMAAFLFAQGEQ